MQNHSIIRTIVTLFCAALFGLIVPAGSAQSSDWMELPLPGSGPISAIHAGNGFLLAARKAGLQNTGVYRSANQGQMWTPVTTFEVGTDGSVVNCFVAVGDALYAGAKGVFRSMDKGQSWTPLNNGLRLSFDPNLIPPIGHLAVSGNLMIATAGAPYQAVFLSTDGGQSWAERRSGLPVGTSFIYGPAAIRNDEIYGSLVFAVKCPKILWS
jgi:photosystem II stability/assembly factor-like uncharacterized protein